MTVPNDGPDNPGAARSWRGRRPGDQIGVLSWQGRRPAGCPMLLDWRKLVRMSDDELSRLDVAAVNLACAEGLPGAPTPAQVPECIDRLDHYAHCLADYTRKRMRDFRRNRAEYDGSEAKF